MRWLVTCAALGCASPQGQTVVVAGLEAWLPAEPTVVDAREPLRATARIAHAHDEDGARFEIAHFVTDRPLDDAEAIQLVDKTVRALIALPGAVSSEVRPLRRGDGKTAVVDVVFADGRKGRWRLELVPPRTFWQLSVVGDDEPAVWSRAERFFESIRLPASTPRVELVEDLPP